MKAKEPRLHKHIDFFVEKMKAIGENGIDMSIWCNWLAMDISGDMAYNHELHQMRDSEPQSRNSRCFACKQRLTRGQ